MMIVAAVPRNVSSGTSWSVTSPTMTSSRRRVCSAERRTAVGSRRRATARRKRRDSASRRSSTNSRRSRAPEAGSFRQDYETPPCRAYCTLREVRLHVLCVQFSVRVEFRVTTDDKHVADSVYLYVFCYRYLSVSSGCTYIRKVRPLVHNVLVIDVLQRLVHYYSPSRW